jgi:hypothetical protein
MEYHAAIVWSGVHPAIPFYDMALVGPEIPGKKRIIAQKIFRISVTLRHKKKSPSEI